jgi:hypothetical protein
MQGNWVAKHSHKYNKHVVHRDKTKVRPKKRMSRGEIYDELYEEEGTNSNTDDLCTEVERPVCD